MAMRRDAFAGNFLGRPPAGGSPGQKARAPRPSAPLAEGIFSWLGESVQSLSSTRVLDRLVTLQRADRSWELDQSLADVLGVSLSDLVAATSGAAGDTEEVRRAWATALALVFLENGVASDRAEWDLLAAKARRWLGR